MKEKKDDDFIIEMQYSPIVFSNNYCGKVLDLFWGETYFEGGPLRESNSRPPDQQPLL